MSTFTAPILTSERLRLREPAPADLSGFLALRSDPAVMRWLGGAPDTEEGAWHRLMRYIGHWRCFGYGFFLVEEVSTGALIGELGLAQFHRGLGRAFDAAPEAGWMLAAQVQGRGYATEALGLLLGWADERFPQTVCMIDPVNLPSLKLADRLGYRAFGEGAYHGGRRTLLRRDRKAVSTRSPQ